MPIVVCLGIILFTSLPVVSEPNGMGVGMMQPVIKGTRQETKGSDILALAGTQQLRLKFNE